MTEHLSPQIIEGYRLRSLPPTELLDADDHLVDCEVCRLRLYQEPQAQSALASLRADFLEAGLLPDHFSEERLAAYVDGALDETDREIADSHLRMCLDCAGRLDELRSFTAQIAAFPAKEYAPAPQTSLSSPGVFTDVRTWLERLQAFIRVPIFQLSFGLTVAGLVLAFIFWAAVSRVRNPQAPGPIVGQQQREGKPPLESQGADDSTIVIALNDGEGKITLDKQGNLAGAPEPYRDAVRQALTTGRIDTPESLAALIGKSGTLMGPAAEGHPFTLLSPVGTAVMSDRPVFRWRALQGADQYVVRIYDADFNEIAVSPELSTTFWTAPQKLERGRTYSWQVTARVGSEEVVSPVRPAPEARFLILDQAKTQELSKAEKNSAGRHLTLAVLYAQAGLLDDAERELQSLLRANPQSEPAQKLLRGVRAKRRS